MNLFWAQLSQNFLQQQQSIQINKQQHQQQQQIKELELIEKQNEIKKQFLNNRNSIDLTTMLTWSALRKEERETTTTLGSIPRPIIKDIISFSKSKNNLEGEYFYINDQSSDRIRIDKPTLSALDQPDSLDESYSGMSLRYTLSDEGVYYIPFRYFNFILLSRGMIVNVNGITKKRSYLSKILEFVYGITTRDMYSSYLIDDKDTKYGFVIVEIEQMGNTTTLLFTNDMKEYEKYK